MEAQCEARQGHRRRYPEARLRVHPLPSQRQGHSGRLRSLIKEISKEPPRAAGAGAALSAPNPGHERNPVVSNVSPSFCSVLAPVFSGKNILKKDKKGVDKRLTGCYIKQARLTGDRERVKRNDVHLVN